jgi:hypothetical protein
MSRSITFRFPQLPESINSLYTVRHGRKILSDAGREYRNRFITEGGGISKAELMAFDADQEQEYKLEVLYLLEYENLYNISYGLNKATKSPFRDMDVTNLIKLPEDCIAKLLGIRDRNNWTVILHKRETPTTEMLIARLEPLDLNHDIVPQELYEAA